MADQDAKGHEHQGVDYQRFFELGVDAMVVARPDGYFEMVNPAFLKLLGMDRATILANPWASLIHPEDVDMVSDESSQAFTVEHRARRFESRLVDSSGVVHSLEWSSELDPETGLVYGTVRDITSQKTARVALEAALAAEGTARASAEAANLAKSEFLSRMSHELRTPLNAILGFAQILELDDIDAEQRASVDQILAAGRHLLGLIDEILDIARIELGEITISLEQVPVADTVAQVVSLLGPIAANRSMALRSTPPDPSCAFVLADRGRLHQVLVNFLSNALKYTPAGGTASVASSLLPDAWVRITVSDNGPGIAPELVPRLFSPFERIGAEQSNIEGAGLGLAHSKALTDRMGGRIGVDSTVGAGSSFWIELPAAEGDDRVEFEVRDLAEASSTVTGTVLYIEDNPSNIRLLARVLELRPGVQLQTATLGKVGLELARRHPPDLIALDLHLPDISGETVLTELLADPRTAQIPVIVLSADATRRQVDHLLSLGVRAYLTKPLDLTHLLSVMDGIIG